MTRTLRLGTRASNLARAQAQKVAENLRASAPDLTIEIHAMTTAGDRELHKKLSDWGYKGLFTRELEVALEAGAIDLAVHSVKDMPSRLPDGLVLAGVLSREEVRDAWISSHYAQIADVPKGCSIGTSSARRKAQLLHLRPDLIVHDLRGNVETRLRKLAEGEVAATFLSAAGLMRLGLEFHIRTLIAPDTMLPAAAQGAIGIECRSTDANARAHIAAISHAPTFACITAERAFLDALDGSCRTPIAGLAELKGDRLTLRGEVLSLDGTQRVSDHHEGQVTDAEALGRTLGDRLRARAQPLLST